MKHSTLLAAALMTVSLSTAIAQHPKSDFSLRLEMERQTEHAGSKIRGQVTLTNTTDHEIEAYGDRGGDAHRSGFTIDVHDTSGRSPELTAAGSIIVGEPGTRTLKPGESLEYHLDLNELYRITNPAEYTVQVSLFDGTTKTDVRSNSVQITVTK